MTISQPTVKEVDHYEKSAEDMIKEGLFPRIHTLLSLREGYHDPSTGIRRSVQNTFCYGERVADLVDTTDAEELSNGFLRLTYVQRPEIVIYQGETRIIEGGKKIICDVPKSGWQVPTSDGLWHPETGAAIATVPDRSEAVRQLQKYIESNPDKFRNWEISKKFAKYWMIQFESNLDELSYVEKLALVETSFQWRPVANSGVWSVGRGLWYRLEGQFDVSLDIKL